MNKEVETALKQVFENFDKKEVSAVYLTGSHLNNLNREDSDVDLYVILNQEKKNLVKGVFVSGQLDGESDFKYMETYKFVQLLYKTNPNLLELVFKYPLYVSEDFKELADFLYENSQLVVTMNSSRYFSSSYHMLKNNYNKLKNGTGKVAKNRTGKELVNFYKTYYQAINAHKGKPLKEFVCLSGELQKEMMLLKNKDVLTKEETVKELENMEKCLSELNELNIFYKETKLNNAFFDKMVELL